jgi:hypothetical protein
MHIAQTKLGVVTLIVLAGGAFLLWYLPKTPPGPSKLVTPPPVTPVSGGDNVSMAPSDRQPERVTLEGIDKVEELAYASESELLQAHLKVAPRELQDKARNLFLRQAQHYEEKIKQMSAFDSLTDVMAEIDNQFSAQLRLVAAKRLSAGKGLLVVDGGDYRSRVKGKHHLLWDGGELLFGTRVAVLVVLDEPDALLQEVGRSYVEARAVWLADSLQDFNNQPYEKRVAEVQAYREFQARRPFKEPAKHWFGVEWRYHEHVYIQLKTLQVVPRER